MGSNSGRPSARRLMVELIGPAGGGKTTLADALCARDERTIVAPHLKFRQLRNSPFLIAGATRLLPILLPNVGKTPGLTKDQITMMLHLNTWNQALDRRLPMDAHVILLDHGPLYMLASLREFGPEVTRTKRFGEWWNERQRYWATNLDMVIFLDAPNEILSRRINMRPTAHRIKGAEARDASEFLSRYRKGFSELLSMVENNPSGPLLVGSQTHSRSTQEIMTEVLDALEPLK